MTRFLYVELGISLAGPAPATAMIGMWPANHRPPNSISSAITPALIASHYLMMGDGLLTQTDAA